MRTPQEKIGPSVRIFAFLLFAVFAIASVLPAIPVPVWTARNAAIQVLSAFAFLWVLLQSWRAFCARSARGTQVLTLDVLDLLLLAVLGWFTISAGNSKQPFESSVALREALATGLWWFILRSAWRRWPGLFRTFTTLLMSLGAIAGLWIVGQTIQARWVAPNAYFTRVNLFAAIVGGALLTAGWTARKSRAGVFLTWAGVLALSLALTAGLRLEQRWGPFPNVNIAAGFLGAVLIVAVFRALRGGWGMRALVILLFLAWAVTQSRGAFFSMVVVVAAVLVVHMRAIETRLSSWDRARWWTAVLAVLVVLVALLPMTLRFFNALDMDPRAYWRWFVWESGFRMALQAPLLGYGPGTFEEMYPYFRSGAVWASQNPFAHCEYLQVAAECGWPALAGVLLLTLFTGFNLFKRFKTSPAAEWAFWILLYTALHNAVDFTFHEWSVRLLLIALVTYALRERVSGEMDLTLHFSRRFLGLAASVAAFLIFLQFGWFSMRDYLARSDYHRGVVLQKAGDLEAAEKALKKSLVFRPDFMGPWNSLAALELEAARRAGSRPDAVRHERRSREFFLKAMAVAAYSTAPRENYVSFLEKTGSLNEALDFQQKLTAGMPAYPPYYLREAEILLRLDRPREAARRLAEALKVDAYYLPARMLRAEVLERSGDLSGARKEYETLRGMLQELQIKDERGLIEGRLRRLGGG